MVIRDENCQIHNSTSSYFMLFALDDISKRITATSYDQPTRRGFYSLQIDFKPMSPTQPNQRKDARKKTTLQYSARQR